MALHPDRVRGGDAEQATALEQFNEVVEAFERLTRADGDWRFRQEADFSQWLRDELEWAREKLRSQRGRVLSGGSAAAAAAEAAAAEDSRTHVVPVQLRPEQREEAERKVAARRRAEHRSARLAKLEQLEVQQEIDAELQWAMAKVAADRKRDGRPSEKEELAGAARRLAELGIDVARINRDRGRK